MSRERAKKYHVPIFRTVADALTLGGDKLAVDGVLLIGEHGDYPMNDKEQKLYPRFEMFLKITDVFRQSGRSVPVFNDKHLSWSWRQAKRMVEISRELKFPMLAGSSAPVAVRVPAVDTLERLSACGSYFHSGLDIYGFHVLEALQAMTERRRGGETGVRSVQCLQRQDCWNFIEQNAWTKSLPDAPQRRQHSAWQRSTYAGEGADGIRRRLQRRSEGGGVSDDRARAGFHGRSRCGRSGGPVSTLMNPQNGKPHHHFGCSVKNIEKMLETGKAPLSGRAHDANQREA